MTFEIKRIPLAPVIKIAFVLYFVFLFLVMMLYTAFMATILNTLGGLLGEFDIPIGTLSGFPLFVAALFMAFFAAIMNTVITSVVVILYNAISGYIGGVKLEIHSEEWDAMHNRMVRSEESIAEVRTFCKETCKETSLKSDNPQEADSPGSAEKEEETTRLQEPEE